MKTFEDLEFKPHHNSRCLNTQAKIEFENGYGVSVVTGEFASSSDEEPYEVAILHNGKLTYETHITNDVLGYQTAENVSDIMKQVQELK